MAKNLTQCARCGKADGRPMTFRPSAGKSCYVHTKGCSGLSQTRDTAKSAFRFVTSHIGSDPNLGPIEVQSLSHLRRLEKEHGVVSAAANYDSSNMDSPPRSKEQFHSRR